MRWRTATGECVMTKLFKTYYPPAEEIEEGCKAITKLYERMAEMKKVELCEMEPEIEALAERYPGFAEFLAVEPEEIVRRYKMGREAAKILTLR
ncbi:MAG: hypothetical protein WC878_05160 [Candidatus Paceibacterota bacterium]